VCVCVLWALCVSTWNGKSNNLDVVRRMIAAVVTCRKQQEQHQWVRSHKVSVSVLFAMFSLDL